MSSWLHLEMLSLMSSNPYPNPRIFSSCCCCVSMFTFKFIFLLILTSKSHVSYKPTLNTLQLFSFFFFLFFNNNIIFYIFVFLPQSNPHLLAPPHPPINQIRNIRIAIHLSPSSSCDRGRPCNWNPHVNPSLLIRIKG